MERVRTRYTCLAIALFVAVAVVTAVGCQGLLTTAVYLIKGTDDDPDFKGLQKKRVAVVCRPLAALQFRNASVAKDLAREVNVLLAKSVPKIHMVEQQKVESWLDEHTDQDAVKVGQALQADMVLAIDLEQFSLYEGQTIYRGKANITIQVHDIKENKVVFEKNLPPTTYPPDIGIPTSDKQETVFRRQFVHVLADQIGRYFYAHDPHADVGLDAEAYR